MRLAWFKPRQLSAAWCGRPRQQIGSRRRSKETTGSRHPSSVSRRVKGVARRRARGGGVEARAGIGAADDDRSSRHRPSPQFPSIWSRPRRRPFGAGRSAPSRNRAAASISVSGRPAAARLPSRSKASSRRHCNPRPTATSHCGACRRAPACAIVSVSMGVRRHCPTRRRDFSRKGRTGPRKSSILESSLGPTGRGTGGRASSSSSTRCMSAPSRRWNLGGRCA